MLRKKISGLDIIIFIILMLLTLICLVPILNTVAISLSDKTSAGLGKVFIWPINFTTAPYVEILKDGQFFRSFLNSVLRIVLGGVINVVLCIMMAYPLSKDSSVFRAKNIYLWFIIFTMLFNGGLVPNFLLVKNLGLIDHIWALVLPGAVQVFSIIILMNYFRTLPPSLEEAAQMDGANPFYILWKILIPLAKPSIAVITLFSVVNHWNSFFDGLIYINSPAKVPLQTYIQSINASVDYQNINSLSPEELLRRMELSSLTFNSAKIIVSMIPIIIMYPLLQRYFLSGMIMGAVKE
jgi:ABC-type glycerol-3-phosphate transport system permease component